ncbi:MAG: hypothetical protein KJZ62_09640 [Fimbriimonadaceae bacterium]|nr:hypothetical protein [Fimbriimonadaceae bacterium]MCL4285355.1 hypothetical protein [Fimbriimonadaceae bacterium]QOJ11721.1 MAG: hypothetical protein HRU74_06530 [Chthonomonadaceae bacterium]
MASPEPPKKTSPPRVAFPWLGLALLLASVYVFWILPQQSPPSDVSVTFDRSEESRPQGANEAR